MKSPLWWTLCLVSVTNLHADQSFMEYSSKYPIWMGPSKSWSASIFPVAGMWKVDHQARPKTTLPRFDPIVWCRWLRPSNVRHSSVVLSIGLVVGSFHQRWQPSTVLICLNTRRPSSVCFWNDWWFSRTLDRDGVVTDSSTFKSIATVRINFHFKFCTPAGNLFEFFFLLQNKISKSQTGNVNNLDMVSRRERATKRKVLIASGMPHTTAPMHSPLHCEACPAQVVKHGQEQHIDLPRAELVRSSCRRQTSLRTLIQMWSTHLPRVGHRSGCE